MRYLVWLTVFPLTLVAFVWGYKDGQHSQTGIIEEARLELKLCRENSAQALATLQHECNAFNMRVLMETCDEYLHERACPGRCLCLHSGGESKP